METPSGDTKDIDELFDLLKQKELTFFAFERLVKKEFSKLKKSSSSINGKVTKKKLPNKRHENQTKVHGIEN